MELFIPILLILLFVSVSILNNRPDNNRPDSNRPDRPKAPRSDRSAAPVSAPKPASQPESVSAPKPVSQPEIPPADADGWVFLFGEGNSWDSTDYYFKPETGEAKVVYDRIIYWGHHDESDSEHSEYPLTMEELLSRAYPRRDAISLIQKLSGKDCTEAVDRLEEEHRIPLFTNDALDEVTPLEIPAGLVREGTADLDGRLTMHLYRYAFQETGSSIHPAKMGGTLKPHFLYGYAYSINNRGNLLSLDTEHTALDFRLTEDAMHEVEAYSKRYTRLRDQIEPYQASIAENCVTLTWPGVTHPFFKAHKPEAAQVRTLFETLLGQDRAARPYVLEPLPWMTEKITVERPKESLSVSVALSTSGDTFRYTEQENMILITYLRGTSGAAPLIRCRLSFIDQPGADAAAYLPPESARWTATGPDTQVLKLRDPFGMAGCFVLERSVRKIRKKLTRDVWKVRLREFARRSVGYPIDWEKEQESGGTWRFYVRSTRPEAFHDETEWDDTEVRLTAEPPRLGEDYQRHELSPSTTSTLKELLAPCRCTVSSFKYSTQRSLSDYQTIVKTLVELEDSPDGPLWIVITRDEGEM